MNTSPLAMVASATVLLAIGLSVPASATASDASNQSSSDSAAPQLEEVIVTARRKQVNLQRASSAISSFSGEAWDQSNISRLDNFNGYVPGLNVAKNDGAGRVVSIRGIGWETAQNIGSQPSVLTYIDGVYLANPLAFGLDLGDIERVEVHRGPQGTEFGQGTTGGAINIVTHKPRLDEWRGQLELGVGSFDAFRGRAAMNIPLGGTAALRASFQKNRHDGFAEIEGGALDGYDLDDADSTTTKLAFKWQPHAQLELSAQVFVQASDQNAAAQKSINDPNRNARELTQDFPGFFELDNTSASLHATWRSNSGMTVRYLAGYQKLEKAQSVDGDRLTEATIAIDISGFGTQNNFDVLPFWDNNSDATSHELNISYADDTLDWVAGLYYLDHENLNDFLEAAGPAPFSASSDAINNPSAATLPPFASVLQFNEVRQVDREDTAIYTQGTWKLSERYALTAGLRYQDEKQRDFGAQFFGVFGGFDRDSDDAQVTWRLGLDVNLSENHLLYGLVSTGWKNGGTNPGAVTNNALYLGESFDAEEVTAYEIGSRNMFLDGRGRFNVSIFYYDHENLQFIFEDPVPFGGGTGTVPESQEYGIETEFSFLLAKGWTLDGAVSWQDGEITSDVLALDVVDFRNALAPGIGLFTADGFATRLALANATNLKGNEPPKLPDLLARLALTNNHQFGNGSRLASRLEYVHRGEFQARVFNNAVDEVPAYDLVNLHMRYELADSPVTFSLSVTNLFDEDGVNNVFTNPFGLLTTSEEFIPPRQIVAGVQFTWD